MKERNSLILISNRDSWKWEEREWWLAKTPTQAEVTRVYIANVTLPSFKVIHPASATEHCTVCAWHCYLEQIIMETEPDSKPSRMH